MAQKYTVKLVDSDRIFEFEGTEEFATGVALAINGCEPTSCIISYEPTIALFGAEGSGYTISGKEPYCVDYNENKKYVVESIYKSVKRGAQVISRCHESKKSENEPYFVDYVRWPFSITLKLSKEALDGFVRGFSLLEKSGDITVFRDGKQVQKIEGKKFLHGTPMHYHGEPDNCLFAWTPLKGRW
jgi:hypothetical protein